MRENTDDHAPRKLAIDELRRLKTERDAAVRNKLAELSEAATAAFNNGDMVGSVAMLRNYSSPIAEQTAAGRETQAVRLEKMAAERQTEADLAVKQVLAAMNMSVARSVLAGDLQNAINVVRQNQNDLRFMGQAENLKQLVEQLQNILTLQGRIMASFAGVNASASDVEFKGQTERIEVRNVSSLTATAFRITKQGSGIARISRDFNYYDLSVNERLKRLPDTKTPETLILRGLLAMENREVSAARQFFINSSVSLGRIMLEYLDTMAKAGETAAGKFQSKVKP
ncbi:MAG: hypothetical protein BWY71_00531 [Planctomycetes bacterium ADurb.Bin412]|nr:MAG: hypothetical protein BWY71_00531 [Planctomycetes bacterium ADurb.Bin412]